MGQGGAWGCQVAFLPSITYTSSHQPRIILHLPFPLRLLFFNPHSTLAKLLPTHLLAAYTPAAVCTPSCCPVSPCHLSIQALVCRNGTAENSLQKLHLILQLCRELGIYTSAAKLGGLCIVPLLSWHHSSWDTEPDIQGVPHVSALSIADYGACSWPQTGPGMISDLVTGKSQSCLRLRCCLICTGSLINPSCVPLDTGRVAD